MYENLVKGAHLVPIQLYCQYIKTVKSLFSLTIIETLLQVVHDLSRVTDDVSMVDQHRHLTGRIEMHEPGLVVLTEREAHIVLLTEQTFLCYSQTHLRNKF